MGEGSQREEHERLLDEWERGYEDRHGGEIFIRDGAPYEDEYWARTPRVCFVLKEANALDAQAGNRDFRKWYREKPWTMLEKWAVAVVDPTADFDRVVSSDPFERVKTQIAVVNLKKSAGGNQADDSLIQVRAREDRDLIRRQIDLLDPDVVIGGGKDSVRLALLWIFELEPRQVTLDDSRPLEWAEKDGRRFVFLRHPSVRGRGGTGRRDFELLRDAWPIVRSQSVG